MINLKEYITDAKLIDILKLLHDLPYGSKITILEAKDNSKTEKYNIILENESLEAVCVSPFVDIFAERQVKELLPIDKNKILIVLKPEGEEYESVY